MDLSFFSSSEGIAIAWLCTVLGCGYAIFQQVQVYKINQTLNSVNLSYTELKVKNENLKIENNLLLIKIENYKNHQKVQQKGKNNINQGVINGDLTLALS